jgi:hypothetical protein
MHPTDERVNFRRKRSVGTAVLVAQNLAIHVICPEEFLRELRERRTSC